MPDRKLPNTLFARMREVLRVHHYSLSTEKAYLSWVRRFIRFHGMRHPNTLGKRDVESFLTDLAVKRKVAPSTQNLALSSILFLYQKVLETELPWLDDVVRAKPRRRVPVVLSRNEVGCASADPVSALRSACSMVPVYGSWNVFACGSEM